MSRMRTLDQLPEVFLPLDFAHRPGAILAAARREHGPIFRTVGYDGERRLYLVGPEANRAVMLAEDDTFSNYEGWSRTDTVVSTLGPGLIFMDGAEHQRLRRAATPAFSAQSVARYLPAMHAVIAERVASWRDQSVIDLYAETYQMTFEIAALLLLGLQREAVGHLSALFHELLSLNVRDPGQIASDPRLSSDRRLEIGTELRTLLRPALSPSGRPGTAIARLAAARDAEGRVLSEERVIDHANALLLAGHVTTSSLSAFLLHRLATNRHEWELVADEQRSLGPRASGLSDDDLMHMPLLDRVIKEGERLFPPVPALPRGVTRDVVFDGHRIPKGETVLCSIAGTHMSEDIFRKPEQFDPARFGPGRAEDHATPLGLVAFGAGPRRCLGFNMARAETKLIVAHVLAHVELEHLPSDRSVGVYHPVLTPTRGLSVRVGRLR